MEADRSAASDCLYPLPDGRRCCECATCQGYELLPSEELILERREEQRRENESSAARIRRRHRLGALLSPPYTCRHGKRLRAVAFNVYRGCGYSCGTTEPERWWHKLGWKLTAGRFDPFGRTASGRKPW